MKKSEIRLEVVENSIAHSLYLGLGFKKFTHSNNSKKLLMRRLNSIAIMQPYLFPNIQYFQLMHSVDSFVYLDDVNFRKASWINNNYIRAFKSDDLVRFNIPIKKISELVLIADTNISQDSEWEIKFLKQLYHCYSKAPQFKFVFPLLEEFVSNRYSTIAELAIAANSLVNHYLEIEKSVYVTSSNYSDSRNLKGSERLFSIINQSGFSNYINSIGGRSLYSIGEFESQGVALHFLESKSNEVNRGSTNKYSIIDNLMRYQKGKIREQILEYRFV
jgi:hypothetical protein